MNITIINIYSNTNSKKKCKNNKSTSKSIIDEFIKKELLKRYLFNNYGKDIDRLNNNHLKIILSFLREGITNSKIDLPNRYYLVKEYDSFTLRREVKFDEYCYEITDKVLLPNNHVIEVVKESTDNSNFTTHLDISSLDLPLYVRNCKPADKMVIKNMIGSKKISDIFTNEKINLVERKSWPVVVDKNGKIIWLPGLKKTHFDRKNSEKYDIILKYY